jgi:hypothetical protein
MDKPSATLCMYLAPAAGGVPPRPRHRLACCHMTPTYRERLRLEGLVLAGAAALGCVLLLAAVPEATDRAASTIGQLVFVALLIAVFAPRMARRALSRARQVQPGEQPSGQPTALWKPPLVLLVLATPFVVAGELGVDAAGWDAGLRVAGGCLLVGLAQALLVERLVRADEARTGRTYLRLPGSSASRGTTLGFFRHEEA